MSDGYPPLIRIKHSLVIKLKHATGYERLIYLFRKHCGKVILYVTDRNMELHSWSVLLGSIGF